MCELFFSDSHTVPFLATKPNKFDFCLVLPEYRLGVWSFRRQMRQPMAISDKKQQKDTKVRVKGVLNTFTIFLLCVLFQSLLRTHDSVAKRDFEPALPPLPDDAMEEDEESVKIVSLVKTKEPLVSICVTVNLQSDHQQKLSDFSLHFIVLQCKCFT